FTTVEDLAKWAHNFEDPKVGGQAVIDRMLERGVLNNGEKLDYAFGLTIGEYKGLKTVGHSGGDAGFRSHIVMFPEQRLSVCILSNLGSFNPGRMALQGANIYLADLVGTQEQEAEKKDAVKVDPSVFDNYEGKYVMDNGWIINITKDKDRLMGVAVGQAKFELFPESETAYFLKIADARILFHPEKDGKTNRFTLRMGGQDIQAKRVESPALTPEQLEEYTGDFYSPELGTTYTIVLEGKNLVVRHRRHGDNGLTATDIDQFNGSLSRLSLLKFIRSEDKKITGFLLTGGRVRSLRFEKQN
ncbi:MAG: DUF3471 domain-containing protein, partial [Candidatus Aminicenantes bacterium]|nr:DUF3471 domain-containing protein [Candidatus Aminicenantes bacterium]